MRKRTDHRYNILYSGLFCLAILVPLVAGLTGWYRPPEVSERENRQLARKPRAVITYLDPFPEKYESWYNDHFFLREKLIDLRIWIQANWIGESPFPSLVTIGKKGWFFDAAKERNIFEGKTTIPPEGYNYVMRELHLRTLWYRARGIHFYVLIAPMKHEIYPEYLPAYYRRAHGGTLTDRFVNYLRKDTVIRLITPREAFLSLKYDHRLYAKMDNHWNYVGAYFAYRELMKEISKDFPQVRPLEMDDFLFREEKVRPGNLASMAGLAEKYMETDWTPVFNPVRSVDDTYAPLNVYDPFPSLNDSAVRRHIPGSDLPSIMVIRDSYGIHLFPFLSETFGRTFMYFDGWNYRANRDVVLQENPDIVVLEVFETHFRNIMLSSLDLVMEEYNRKNR